VCDCAHAGVEYFRRSGLIPPPIPSPGLRSLGTNAKRTVAPPETGRVLPGGEGKGKEEKSTMELIAVAVAFYAVFMPMFLAMEIACAHPQPARLPVILSAEEAAARYLAANPLKARPAAVAANDGDVRRAA
jgi:hypothetical protein